jgi:hypothetical protein
MMSTEIPTFEGIMLQISTFHAIVQLSHRALFAIKGDLAGEMGRK